MRAIICFLFVFLPNVILAQQYNFHNYSVKEGIAQSQVYCMLQDSRGYLWMGTRGGGLTRFDGLNFTTYTIKNGLSNNYILSIKEDKHNNLWIGTNNGLSCYNGIEFKNYFPSTKNPVQIIDIDFDVHQKIWLASSEGVLQFNGKEFTNVSQQIKDGQRVINSILCSKQGNIFYANANGLYTLQCVNGKYQYVLNKNYTQINCIRQDLANHIWLGTYGMGVFKGDGKIFTQITSSDFLQHSVVWNINFDKKNNPWISTLSDGVVQLNAQDKPINILTEQEGLSNNHVRCMLQDQSGNYWFGTSGGGVCNYFGKMFTHYDKANGLGGDFIYSIFKDNNAKIWIGTSNKGLTIFDSTKFYTINASNGFADVKVKAIAEDNYGTMYLGTDGDGLFVFRDSLAEKIKQFNGQYIRAIIKDKEGLIWVATAGNGIYKISPTSKSNGSNLLIENYNLSNGSLLANRVSSLLCDQQNRIWYGTESSGVGCLSTKLNITVKNGLPSDAIRTLVLDKTNRMWIGTAGDGMASLNLTENTISVSRFENEKLSSSNIYLIASDAKNNLLVGSETGIDYLVLNSERKILDVKHYSKGDGFVGIETCLNAVCDNGDGTFWFGTINGLTKYNPSNLVKNESETITNITDVRLFYISLFKTKFKKFVGDWNKVTFLELPYNQNHLSFDFLGINFSNPEAVKYKWKLEGFDAGWSPISTQRTVTYSNIPSGIYQFKVMSCNEEGVWNKKASSIQIVIHKPFWKEWWFVSLFILLLLGLIWIVFRTRERNIKKKAQDEQQKIILEKELIELEHKALRLQMNPHFIFNALNSIQSQIGTDNEQNARYYLAKFSKLMRQILDNSRNNTISLQEEISMLDNYLLVEKFCNNDMFDYKIHLQDDLELDYIKIPPMILQPFVENAIKHGMKYLASKRGLIELSFKEENNMLICAITDNGVGRKKAEELNKLSREHFHKSTALKVTEERLSLLHQNDNGDNIHIVDLYDDAGAGAGAASGTKVEVKIPIT